ncbi:hypothetical protein AMATHDRAFT_135616 [Amanita thiersii Skay4041]|uniref:AB hydrolase-1 domain-containing protein n=1 Tax=Amanita thiersii Skay4041 TaxID=703135 RepID=A0A2A9NUB4_9AGAR|nr:hypothetical protein AMATHDRAFT_135616 [Amanita thiersii Skay4041]
MATGYSTVTLPDNSQLAYEVWGSLYLGQRDPIVLVCGMSALRIDFERLSASLARYRPVLLYDHRGMGDSTPTPSGNEEISIELLARDLLFLLTHLGWKRLAICGYSMGGVVAQQLLVLPYHSKQPTPLPFQVTHLLLASTRSVVRQSGLPIFVSPSGKPRTLEERKEIARRVLAATFDPSWVRDNKDRFEMLFKRVTGVDHRFWLAPLKTLLQMGKFNFAGFYEKLPRNIQFLVIHGKLDAVVPFYCGEFLLENIPWAKLVEVGNLCGQVPTLNFGHHWFEYFDIRIWDDVFRCFLQAPKCCVTSSIKSRL